MGSSDEENNHDYDQGINMTGFLFGNIDENGQLEDDILDDDAKQHLASLGRLGLGSLLQEMMSVDQVDDKPQVNNKNDNDLVENGVDSKGDLSDNDDDTDYDAKSPAALDFSDINELAEDFNELTDNETKPKIEKENIDYDADDEGVNKLDKQLMPPPPVPEEKENLTPEEVEAVRQRKLETPLASMLPSKYANVDVTELFPDFRPNKVLRFSRLFGPGKPSSLPQIWRGVRKRRKKKKHHEVRDSDSGSDQEDRKLRFKGWIMNYGPTPTPEMCASDDEIKLLAPVEDKEQAGKVGDTGENGDMGPKVADWRFGPAKIWYDMIDTSETGDDFDYGFKLAEKKDNDNNNNNNNNEKRESDQEFADDAFLMVSQLHWEDDVVWNGDEIKHKVMHKLNSKSNAAGWVPSSGNRTAQAFSQPGKGGPVPVAPNVRLATSQILTPLHMQSQKNKIGGKGNQQQREDSYDDTWYSIFPVENEELVYGLWEDEVIWDAKNMKKIPKPKILTLDPNDENIVLGIPDDIDPALLHKDHGPQPKVKIPHPHVKKSKLLLGKAGVINVLEEDAPPPPPKSPDRDPFNISNDIFYMPRSSETTLRLKVGGGNLIQHSTPVVELRAPFIQTHMGLMRLRNFHRPALKRFSHGPLAHPGPHPVFPLLKHIKKKAKQREQERIASGGGDVFFMRTAEDLTGKDGEIILVEFSEEHPPLMNQVGMCSKMKNYYKRKAGKDTGPPEYKYGETAYAHTSPFLGILTPGQSIQAMENNMYRVPIYEHKPINTDFLVIRTRQQYYIREIDGVFAAGQECPLYEVPGPNSKRANNFVRDFLQVFIYRLFWNSLDTPRRIKMDDIKKAFPSHSESSIRKRLKLCADFKRTGMDSNWWVIKPDFRLPTEEEIRAMVSPEQCCAYFSMIAAEQRLKDAGYGEKFLFTPQDDDDEEMQLKMDDEIKVAPWNTTRAYIQAVKGKCLLQLAGPADPTGCGEGFSYVRVPNKPTISKEEQEAQPKRTVTGTDADLRRLSLNNAKALLRKFGVPEEEIKKLSRWEVIDVVRTLSTEKAKAGEEGMTKFSRGNRFSIAEHQERYKEECQRIFDLQNRVLSSAEVLSTDEGESSDEDSSDIEEMGKNIENMLSNKKTSSQLSLEREEQQRQELRKMLMGESQEQDGKKGKDKKKDDEEDSRDQSQGFNSQPGRVLKIYRTFRNPEGKEYTRVEIVRKPAVIDTYIKIRNSKDETFIKQFATLDDAQKEEMKREKRRIQEQLRRIKRNQEREKSFGGPSSNFSSALSIDRSNTNTPTTTSASSILPFNNFPSSSLTSKHSKSSDPSPSKRKKSKLKPDLKLKCGACGNVGHMRTNKACPLYQNSMGTTAPVNVAMTEEQEEEIEKQLNDDDQNLVNVDGTIVKLSSKVIKRAEEMKKRTLLLKLPKEAMSGKKRRRATGDDHCDYLKRHQKPANRRRTDPVVVMSGILESILNEMRDLPDVQPFLFPVNAKAVPDYYNIVKDPIDLQTIRDNLRQKKYQNRAEFLVDVNRIVENSVLYNGEHSSLTVAAKRMLQTCVQRLAEREEKLMRLEKAINPLLDDDDQVALSYVLDSVTSELKKINDAWPFLKPVNRKTVKDYYNVIKTPMDLETISKKIAANKYHSRNEYLRDVELILENCVQFNSHDSPFTRQAQNLVKVCREMLDGYKDYLTGLENKILLVQQRAMEQADIDSSWMGPDDENYTTVEHDFRGSRTNSPDNPFKKSHVDDFDFVDVEGDVDANESPTKSSSTKKKDVLEEDLQFSSEDEFDEVPFVSEDHREPGDLEGMEIGVMRVGQEGPADDDSQQVAEAMVQLGNVRYYVDEQQYIQQEESMDVDPNYDPSDFLLAGLPPRAEKVEVDKIHDDLAVSESEDEIETVDEPLKQENQQPSQPDEDVGGDLWF
ncbi:transcription initiation factor TFIID subunit 1 [Microplitis demolitor]|uniref:transcription initiation factor TFIID subunit 1 n=1 Tax=Microplitis demolitor TaxID=69319 RepID=UPI0004CD1F93|nr:transcription initiation factor TFIID subunit 1 [Microplitis demolitor]XP_053594526.1 transcription initiation factor TFIID subunit 1 [Microplitis demolitor]